MTHTPSFSKRIHGSSLIQKRLEDDSHYYNQTWIYQWRSVIATPLQGFLDETTAQYLVYSDFYQRTKLEPSLIPIYIGPRSHSLHTQYNISTFIKQYTTDYGIIKDQLNFLGIWYSLYHLYHPTVIDALHHVDKKLVHDHRVWLRSDVVYYDIESWRVVPDHRIEKKIVNTQEYIVRFFLNSNKETLSWLIHHAYDLFGCVAILVNPHDKRYKKARGRDIILPISNRSVPVIPYEGVSVEWLWTRVLVPAHNREDFWIALELWLPIDIYAFDEWWKFTSYAKDFSHKSLQDFSENVIKFLDDISNLESTIVSECVEYRDKYTNQLLYPLLKKNIYIGLWYQSFDDSNFIEHSGQYIWNSTLLENDVWKEENFCITNQDTYQPLLWSFSWYFDHQSIHSEEVNLIQDIVKDFYQWWLLHLPLKWDDIIDIFSLQYDGIYLWKIFFEARIQHTTYHNHEEVYTLLEKITQHIPSDHDIDTLLEYIDLWWYFLHTKQGYVVQHHDNYHYDNDYVALALIIYLTPTSLIDIVMVSDKTTFFKFFLYVHYYYYRKSLQLHIYALEDKKVFWSQWNTMQTLMSDVSRLLLLQACHHQDHDEIQYYYTAEEFDRFLQKRWNLVRIIPQSWNYTIEEQAKELLELSHHMSDYDTYLISTLHELYDDVVFSLQKHHTDHIVSITISTLWNKIADILLYIIKMVPSSVSHKVASYVINFSNHLLYPLAPNLVVWLFDNLWMKRSITFFEKDPTFLVNKNIKCNFLMQFINQWYKETKSSQPIQWFMLKANKDFLDYAQQVLPDFTDFIGKEYIIDLLDEHQERPDGISYHKVFAMQRWVKWLPVIVNEKPIVELQDSLWTLKKQLSYKEQLLQTIKNTLIRMRTSGQREKIEQFQSQIYGLEKEISEIEYQISKLKYF